MFKSILRNIVIYAFSLYLLQFLIGGVKIIGGIETVIIGGIVLTLIFVLLKPIFNVLTFPFNFITLGLFSVITNAVILYLLTIFVPDISITAFRFPGTSFIGFSIQAIQFNTLFAFISAALVLSFVSSSIRWLIK